MASIEKQYVLVTGGVGYIGSHTCVELLNVRMLLWSVQIERAYLITTRPQLSENQNHDKVLRCSYSALRDIT